MAKPYHGCYVGKTGLQLSVLPFLQAEFDSAGESAALKFFSSQKNTEKQVEIETIECRFRVAENEIGTATAIQVLPKCENDVGHQRLASPSVQTLQCDGYPPMISGDQSRFRKRLIETERRSVLHQL